MMRILALAAILFLALQAKSQHQIHFCGFDHIMKQHHQHRPNTFNAYQEVFRKWESDKNNRGGGGGGIYALPVVVHVVYNTNEQNIADSVIFSQIEVLNEDFRRMNDDAVNTRDIFLPYAADCEIEFFLAQTDPEGNSTTGITHTWTDRTSFDLDFFAPENTLDEVKHIETGGVDAWDPLHYINIWVCNIGDTGFGQIFGLSYPPAGLSNWPDGSAAPDISNEGLIVHYTTVGRNNPEAASDGTDLNNSGRTVTHEMGHFLGLRHTWGDEFLFEDVCSADDGMADTPLCASGDQFNCDYNANSCDDGTIDDLPDMIENYMDYTHDVCYNMFSNDQRDFMRFVLEEYRSSLLGGVSLLELASSPEIRVYPNPVSNFLLYTCKDKNDKHEFFVLNNFGQCVLSGRSEKRRIEINKLTPGSYVLDIITDSGSSYSRFIVE